ncbi:beta-caryophyllene synthase [Tanacetum coccineum]
MERGFLSLRRKGGEVSRKNKKTLADVSAMGSLCVEEMTTDTFSEDTNESGLHAYRYAFAIDSIKLNDDRVDLAKHNLNNEATMNGAVPSSNVASWIDNGTQDENVEIPLNEGNVLIDTNDPNNSSQRLSGPTSHANLVTGEPSRNVSSTTRKTMNLRTLISLTGNKADVFNSKNGLDAMLENGPWFIRNNLLILKKWNPDVNLLKKDVGNVSVWDKLHGVPLTAFTEGGLIAIAAKLGTPLMLDSYTSDMCMQSCGRSSYVGAMIELRADLELKDTIVVAMPKLCPKNIRSNVVKNLKTPRQAVGGVQVGPKVSNLNPLDALNSVEDADVFRMNGRIVKSIGKGSLNVAHGSSGNTPIIEKIDKLECQILEEKLTFVDDDGKPLSKVVTKGNEDSESEEEVVFHETTNLTASTSLKGRSDKGYDTNSLLE